MSSVWPRLQGRLLRAQARLLPKPCDVGKRHPVDNVQLWREVMTGAVVLLSAVLLALARQILQGGSTPPAPRAPSDSLSDARAREIGRLWRSLQRCRRSLDKLRSERERRRGKL